jgi:DNA-binding MarR family transcriptional regulator
MRRMESLPSTPQPPQESLGMLLGLVKSELVRAMEQELAAQDTGLRYTQFLAIKRLATLGPMSASELARSLDHDGGAMTRLLDQLEAKGYLRRLPHEQDRRTLRIELTDQGQALWTQIAASIQRVMQRAMRDLDADRQAQLLDSLGCVLHTLRSSD